MYYNPDPMIMSSLIHLESQNKRYCYTSEAMIMSHRKDQMHYRVPVNLLVWLKKKIFPAWLLIKASFSASHSARASSSLTNALLSSETSSGRSLPSSLWLQPNNIKTTTKKIANVEIKFYCF